MDLLANLNPVQAEAVCHKDGPLLVLAGAGSGKTRVLTTRIAYLIKEYGVKPWQILAITFTNKAAREMKERVAAIVPENVQDLWVMTFHAACLRILRRQAVFAGYREGFVIYDQADQQTVLKDCLKELNLDEKRYPPRTVAALISQAKNRLQDAAAFAGQAKDYFTRVVGTVYERYQERLRRNNALDFDDLLMVTVRLFEQQPEVLDYYRQRFRYILVDEYQDTNHAQYVLVNLLAREHRNLCVVGDPDQSIYHFRGADIQNILSFEQDYPEARVIKLEQNYRSTQTILEAANQVITHNIDRKEKNLWTTADRGDPVVVFVGDNERDEAEYVVNRIERLRYLKGLPYRHMAVLYRTHAMSRVLEEALVRRGIPYTMVGGLKFYERKEIKDLLAYLRLLINPADWLALARIINVPRRGIGEASLQKIIQYGQENRLDALQVLLRAGQIAGLGAKIKNACLALGETLAALAEQAAQPGTVTRITRQVLEDTGYRQELELENTVEARTRLENLQEFLTVTRQYDVENPQGNLADFLSGLSLVADVDRYDQDQDSVVLMTLHSAKGLEFPVVFLVGMEEGVFPHFKALESGVAMQEERRLAYVGITRARQKLYMTRCWQRTLYGLTKINKPSRFLQEIPPALLVEVDPLDAPARAPVSRTAGQSARPGGTLVNNIAVSRPPLSGGEAGGAALALKAGDAVRHKKWGVGKVILVKGRGEKLEYQVEFPGLGVKNLLAMYAPLEKL
ncbi:MAG: DNA helicase PcrA [Desulfurispora sp.]|uniref:DNA helicase PcrA n=1 Tax=Desulfurispora sp. TaxID=3014275 RepID=UPI00404B519E